jgi:hypothetical protein
MLLQQQLPPSGTKVAAATIDLNDSIAITLNEAFIDCKAAARDAKSRCIRDHRDADRTYEREEKCFDLAKETETITMAGLHRMRAIL